MQRFEYKVVPAPRKGEKARGLKSTEDRFAHALSQVMNEMARDGWEYHRTDTLPVEERAGLTGTRTVFQNMLVFKKDLTPAASAGTAPVIAVDPMDLAARRAALIAQPNLGAAPKLSASAPETSPVTGAPTLGPATAEPGPDAPKSAAAASDLAGASKPQI